MGRRILVIAALWALAGVFTAGTMNASFRGNYPSLYTDPVWARDKCASFIGVGIAFGPLGLLMSPFMSGFFQHGWTLECGPRSVGQ